MAIEAASTVLPTWAVVLAPSLAAVIGGLIAVWSARSNSKEQGKLQEARLAHETEQKRLERQLAMKRDVYFPAISALAEFQAAIMSLIDPDTDHKLVSQASFRASGPVSHVYAVAAPETVSAMERYRQALISLSFELLWKRTPLVSAKQQFEFCKSEHARIMAYRGQLYQEQQDMVVRGEHDHKEFKILETKIAGLTVSLDYYQNSMRAASSDIEARTVDLLNMLRTHAQDVQKYALEAVQAVRDELGLDDRGDEGLSRVLIEISHASEDLLERFSAMLSNKGADGAQLDAARGA